MLSDVAKTFVGSRVRQLRSERGFSQAALAQMLEISPSYLNQIEHDTPAIVAGEPSSSHPDFPGEDTSLLLPWSGVHGSISSRYHMADGADTRTWIAPQIPVRLTSRDWLENRDPVLDAVLEVIRQRR